MKYVYRYVLISLLGITMSAAIVLNAGAHMMVAQHGTINVVNDGVFIVISLPVSAFSGIDDDKDGKLSITEFNTHRSKLIKAVKTNIQVIDTKGKHQIKGIMLKLATSHHSPKEPVSQLIIMGRFTLTDPESDFTFTNNLYGKLANEQLLEMSATRKIDGEKVSFTLTPQYSTYQLFTHN